MKINAKYLLLGLIGVLLLIAIVVGVLLLQKSTNIAEPVVDTTEVEETKVNSNDLLHTLVWKDDKEKVEAFKKETISGYNKTIEEAYSNPAENKEETTTPVAYNIINWNYAEYNDNTYLSLNYNYDNSNYNVVFYKDIHNNVNIAELYIDNKKHDKESFTTWADKVFVDITPEPTNQDIGYIEEILGIDFYSLSSDIGIRFVSSTEVAILNNDGTIAKSMTYDVYDVIDDTYVYFTLDGYNYFICQSGYTQIEIKDDDDFGNGRNFEYPYSDHYDSTPVPNEEPKKEEQPAEATSDAEVENMRNKIINIRWWDGFSERQIGFEADGTMIVYGYYGSDDGGTGEDLNLYQPYSLAKGNDGVIINIGENGQYLVDVFNDGTMRLDKLKGGVYEGLWYKQ